MTSRDFVYWLQGFFEISGDKNIVIGGDQVKIIKNHLNLVFYHEIDPSYSEDKKVQKEMIVIHEGKHEEKPNKPIESKTSVWTPNPSDIKYKC